MPKYKGVGTGGITPSPFFRPVFHLIRGYLFKDDVTVILLLGVTSCLQPKGYAIHTWVSKNENVLYIV
jgi:hypothetical protein